MQRHKSVEKRDRTSKKANLVNRSNRSRIKTATRSVTEAKDKETATDALKEAVSVLDKSAKIGLIHPNKAANQKSRLSKIVDQIEK
ncbi:30S ribosomal protein S20 [Chitinispirillales bacterium ANBcel5]|uniref:30S ribosomal protein S20 n=1 Tax=Cellulosispirillum alkaliphilum TaxID=3039283 RepID=UPI002A5311FD|nr:30S ribosomal protein S20 [Chitinispirillales bacterium ANBcel5]